MDEGMFVRKFAMVCNNCVCVCVYNDTGKFPQTWRGELIGVYNLITAIQVGEEHPKV